MSYNVSQTRTIVFETKDEKDLAQFLKEELPRMKAETEVLPPFQQKRFVIEWHQDTGFWTICSEAVLKINYGGEIYQEQSRQDLFAQHESAKSHASSGPSTM